jgi:hypothetical protein
MQARESGDLAKAYRSPLPLLKGQWQFGWFPISLGVRNAIPKGSRDPRNAVFRARGGSRVPRAAVSTGTIGASPLPDPRLPQRQCPCRRRFADGICILANHPRKHLGAPCSLAVDGFATRSSMRLVREDPRRSWLLQGMALACAALPAQGSCLGSGRGSGN